MTCKQCKKFEKCIKEAHSLGQVFDPYYDGEHYCGAKQFAPKTNADRIRAMNDEELAKWIDEWSFCTDACPVSTNEVEETIGYHCPANCKEQALKWLQQPCSGG